MFFSRFAPFFMSVFPFLTQTSPKKVARAPALLRIDFLEGLGRATLAPAKGGVRRVGEEQLPGAVQHVVACFSQRYREQMGFVGIFWLDGCLTFRKKKNVYSICVMYVNISI